MRLFTALAVLPFMFASSVHAMVEIGDRAPAFELFDHEGEKRKLEEFKGKKVVLEWTNYQCPFVRKYYDEGHMQHLQEAFQEGDVVWLSIISSAPGKQGYVEPKDIKKAHKTEQSTSILLTDPEGRVGRAYGARTTPHMFLINEEGFVVYQGAIDDIPSFKVQDIYQAQNYIVKAHGEMFANIPVRDAATTPYGCSVKY